MKLPKGALRLSDPIEEPENTCFSEGDNKRLKMQMYSGKPITNHWYWETLVIDLNGMSAKGSRFPILEDHLTSKKIAHTAKPLVTEEFALTVDPNKTVFVSTPESEAFQKLSAEGFPYQASVRGVPTEIQRLGEKEVSQVNGYKLKGPAYIWRKWEFKEGSVTVFGADSKTQSSAFNEKEDVDIDIIGDLPEIDETNTNESSLKDEMLKRRGKEKEMSELKDVTFSELRKENPGLVAQIEENVLKSAEKKFSEKENSFNASLKEMSTQNEKMSAIMTELQKKDAIREEKSKDREVEDIWKFELDNSNIPDHLYDKVMPCVSRNKFTEEGKFDTEKFQEAVKEEIKDWESKGISSDKVQGFTSTSKTVETDGDGTFSQEQTDNSVNALLKSAGHVEKK